jgi:hypothetical protein
MLPAMVTVFCLIYGIPVTHGLDIHMSVTLGVEVFAVDITADILIIPMIILMIPANGDRHRLPLEDCFPIRGKDHVVIVNAQLAPVI